MDDDQLQLLMTDLESDRVERKASATDTDKICEAICACANDLPGHGLPGVLFVGVKDDGTCAGLAISDQTIQTLAAIRSDGNVVPFPQLTVQKKILAGCEVVVVIAHPSDAPPVRYKGRTWIRVGSRRAIATAEEERRLAEKRRSRDLPWDIRPLPSSRLDDLDMELFRRVYLPSALAPDVLEQNSRSVVDQLTALRFVNPAEPPTPTALGVLVSGRDPRGLIPGDYVQFLRIAGKELTDPIQDQKEIDGPLPDLLQRLDEALEAHVSVSSEFVTASVETRRADYPIVALQQLARNGVLHRNYEWTNAPVRITWFDDRVEILSPGGPFGQVNRGNFGSPGITDYRNPHLAEAMKNLGYVQRFGVGISLARKELEKNGNPPLEFTIEDTYILALIRSRP